MKKKQFMSKLAALTMAAAMGITALPATAVFAAEVVSVDASDTGAFSSATTVGDAYKDELNKKLASTTFSTLKSDLQGNAIGTALTNSVTSVTVSEDGSAKTYTMSNYEIKGSTAPSYKTTADGGHIVMPVLTIKADLTNTTDSKPAGTVTFTAEATALTKSEKVDAAAAVINAAGNDGTLDTATYQNADNSGSLATAVNNILGSTKLDNASVLGTVGTDFTLKTTQGTVSAATKTADGAEGVNVELSVTLTHPNSAADPQDANDPKWDKTADQTKDQTYKATASYTATIKKLNVTSEDSDYQTRVANALSGVSFTNEDLKYTDSSDSKVKDLTTASKIESTHTDEIKSGVWTKVAKALDSIGVKENNYSITLRHLTKASHKADGSVEILVDQKRDGDSKDVQYATVTVPISHSKDTVAIGDEVSAKIVDLVKKYVADSKDITPSAADKKAQIAEVNANLTKAVDDALADKLDGTQTIASEIDKVEVAVDPGSYVEAKAGTPGYIKKAKVTVTFKDKAPEGAKLTNPGTGFGAEATKNDKQTVFTYDATVSGAPGYNSTTPANSGIKLYKLDAVEATGVSLDAETVYNDGKTDVTVTPKFTPANANNYTIRWTLKDTDKFNFGAVNTVATAWDNTTKKASTTHDNTATSKTVFTSNSGIKVYGNNVKAGDTVDLTAELIDSDGLVAAKATTTIKVVKGFSDVQNTHDYAYNAINKLSTTETVYKNGKWEKVAIIDGVGNNLFAPDNDVTRAQFVTFLYRLAQTADGQTTNDYDKATVSSGKYGTEVAKYADDTTVENGDYVIFKDADASTKFTDVDANAYYAKAVDWAVANGITSGKTDTTFDPNGKVTRAEAVTFLYRYFAANQSYNAANFSDVSNTAYYANAVGWASSEGVTQGKSATTFAPSDTTTRKEAAAFIYRAEQYNGRIAK